MSNESNILLIVNRVKKLDNTDYLIESFILKCSLFEDILLSLCNSLENKICRIVKKEISLKLDLKKYRGRELEKMTMGNLREILLAYSVINNNLNEDIVFFINIRNECIHGLINNNLNELEKKIKYNCKRFDKLLDNLIKIYLSFAEEEIILLKN